ncbi:MAG: hypothetical protein LBJ95_02550 [Oscillospiraceae bacterium]|nr:hypothetical protein [Oscillospiraceae bacterium]
MKFLKKLLLSTLLLAMPISSTTATAVSSFGNVAYLKVLWNHSIDEEHLRIAACIPG